MIFAGAGGHAKELFELFKNQNKEDDVIFFDDINTELPIIFRSNLHLKSWSELKKFMTKDKQFVLATGDPKVRQLLYEKLVTIGGEPNSFIADSSIVSPSTKLGKGLNIMAFSFLSSDTKIGTGSLINSFASIHHDSAIGDFCEIGPGARILGNVVVGEKCFMGSNSVILPNITIGNNVVIGAGAVVTKNIPGNTKAYGVPAKNVSL